MNSIFCFSLCRPFEHIGLCLGDHDLISRAITTTVPIHVWEILVPHCSFDVFFGVTKNRVFLLHVFQPAKKTLRKWRFNSMTF